MTKFDRNHPALCTIKERYPLTKEGSTKQTWHITLDLGGIDLAFEPGDSVGIYAQNDPTLVSHLIDAIGYPPDQLVTDKRSGDSVPLEQFLKEKANLNQLTSKFLKLIHECEECPKIASLLTDKSALKRYLAENDPLGVLKQYQETKIPLQDLVDQFGPLLPRFYSVASCGKTHPQTLDLTVALFTWMQEGEKRYGVASHFLCNLATIGQTSIPLFVQPAPHFRLPADPNTHIVMIGPGTGVAPFRAFLQDRKYSGATGKNWLFFGERNRSSDYFYEEEFTSHPNLRIETAFSRDQDNRIYVQHKLKEHATELYGWLEEGAHIYVCGDAKEMAKDVEAALIHIIQAHRSIDEKGAKEHLKTLRKEGRYLLDVY